MSAYFRNLPTILPRPVTPEGVRLRSSTSTYTLQGLLGEGATGCVYTARRISNAENASAEYAIKIALPLQRIVGDDKGFLSFLARFSAEAKRGMQLSHEGIVPVVDYGIVEVDATGDPAWDGAPFFVMPYLAGRSLSEAIREGAKDSDRFKWLIQLSEALVYLHMNGVQHRDVKPENILVTHNSQLLLLDFGVAKWGSFAPQHTDRQSTKLGDNLTTWEYTPPEVELGAPYDHKSEVWSFSKVALEILVGQRVPRVSLLLNCDPFTAIEESLRVCHPFLAFLLSSGLEDGGGGRPSLVDCRDALRDYADFLATLETLRPGEFYGLAPRGFLWYEKGDICTRIRNGEKLRISDFPAWSEVGYMRLWPKGGCPKCGSRLWISPSGEKPCDDFDGAEFYVCFGGRGTYERHYWETDDPYEGGVRQAPCNAPRRWGGPRYSRAQRA